MQKTRNVENVELVAFFLKSDPRREIINMCFIDSSGIEYTAGLRQATINGLVVLLSTNRHLKAESIGYKVGECVKGEEFNPKNYVRDTIVRY
jgi:hypothetical protein